MKRFKKRSAKMNVTHYSVLVRRQFRQILSNVKLFASLLLQAPIMLIISLLVYNKNTFAPTVNVVGATTIIFVLVFVSALMGILNSYSAICNERDILTREVFGGLDVTGYLMAKFTVLAVIGLVQCLILGIGALLCINFSFGSTFSGSLQLLLALYLTNISVAAMGLLISSLLKDAGSAILPVLVVIIVQVVFSDAVFTLNGWVNEICKFIPTMWGVSVIGKSCDLNNFWEYGDYKEMYGYSPFIGFAVLIALTALCLILAIVKLKYDYRSKE